MPGSSIGRLLDAGCGTGGLLRKLNAEFPEWHAAGIDADEGACSYAASEKSALVCVGSVNQMPFADNCFGAIISADVLYHRNVDEGRALNEFRRCLRPGGVLVLNVPAYQWLYSAHDRSVHAARRYTRAGLERLLRDAGFSEIVSTYWNTFLFPLMVLRRVLTRNQTGGDVIQYPAVIDRAFRGVMRMEGALLERGMRMPFGGSVLAAAVKKP